MAKMLGQWTPAQLDRDLELLHRTLQGRIGGTTRGALEASGLPVKVQTRLLRALVTAEELKHSVILHYRRVVLWETDIPGKTKIEVRGRS